MLADKNLSCHDNFIDNVDFILGSKSCHCLPQNEILFGLNRTSVYAETQAGILLQGNTDQLLQDLPYLPYKVSSGNMATVPEFNIDMNINSCLLSDLTIEESLLPTEFSILDEKGNLIESQLEKALNNVLEENCSRYTNMSNGGPEAEDSELNNKLVKYALDNMVRDGDGRIVVPLLWNFKVAHLLGTNYELALMVLKSNLKKLQKDENKLSLMDKVFKDQLKSGIIQRIDNLPQFLEEHPSHSFLPHMGVFKLNRETTKCRVVYLSNLCQKSKGGGLTISHNQAIFPGPTLNQKIVAALLHLRFGFNLLCFDICQAFNNLSLNDVDSNRLLCLWFRDVEKKDYTIVAFKNVRLSFGLRCSPALLMLALYKILILDIDDESKSLVELKKLIYQLSYMDNCAIAFDSSAELEWAYKQVKGIFEPYHFRLQQFITNDSNLQEIIDSENEVKTDRNVKLLGLVWDREKDCLSTKPINLDIKANTKREVLRTIASQYDLYNFNGPLLNRSRLFLHRLQCDQHLSWDQALDKERSREWQNIAKQANAAPVIKVPRFAGSRDDTYKLIAYSDSSKCIFGVVIYIQCISTGKLSFAFAKNRMVGKNLQSKSMPSLELQSIALAVECLLDLYKELSGPSCIKPIKIQELRVYSDSLVALSWIYSHTHNLDKLQKCSVFVKNRLHEISELCLKHPVIFSFVSGEENPGDCITRCLSYKSLMKTNYHTGPDLVNAPRMEHSKDTLEFVVPDPKMDIQIPVNSLGAYISSKDIEIEHFQMTSRVSSFHRLILIYRNVLLFVNKLKIKVMARDPDKFNHLKAFRSDHNFFAEASRLLLSRDQGCYFAEELEYFNSSERLLKDVPRIVGQLNIYIDREGLLRVRSKLSRLKDEGRYRFPILLSKDSTLTTLIIRDYHERFAHAGVYSVLSEMRKMFWMSKSYSTVKKVLKSCVVCRRFNERAIKLNQNSYRDFRINAPEIPFRYIFMDYMGPYFVHINSQKVKVWLLCITCNWSRAINLKLCYDLSVKEFLRAFQLHCFEFGLPELCISDMGTQLVAGANIIMDFLRDPEVKLYLEENGVKPIQFEHFFKGQSQLGSMVETCVKMTKKLVYGSIKNNVLKVRDFEFLIAQTVHLVNRRPIAFKEALRGENLDASVPQPITPESLIRGYDLTSVNIIPDLQRIPEIADDPTYTLNKSSKIKNCFSHLRKVRNNLVDLYHSEFLATLTQQAVDKKNRYLPVKHTSLQKNDIVLIKELYCKPNQYPMGLVKEVTVNDIGEVTGAVVLKGKTREITKRHVSNLIFLLRPENQIEQDSVAEKPIDDNLQGQTRRACKPRVAAERCKRKNRKLLGFE
ncbi:uncharacterized protein [Palaemon carinicauda]|uniref:uncharacterized protein n=2 Tax=Palaemon carinicauda TaxID=392227 RepID=UPI0035B61382